MSCNNDPRPVLHGTWTASTPQEFFYRPDLDSSHAAGPCCGKGICCPPVKDAAEEKEDDKHSERKRCCVEIESSTGSVGPLTAATLTTPFNIVSTGISTCCIGETDNLVSFNAQIVIPALATGTAATSLVFQVLRSSCIGSAIPVGSTYTFATTTGTTLSSQAFSFSFVDDDVAPGTYTYTVQLAAGTVIGVANTIITNATLNVMATADD